MNLTRSTQAAISAQQGEFINFKFLPVHLRLWWSLCVWFFGSFNPDMRLLPFRRWAIRMAFRFRWNGHKKASDLCWRIARWFAIERTHPALAAYSTRLIMDALMDGREK